MTAAAVAESVILAAGPVVIGLRVHCSGARKWMPPQLVRGRCHALGEFGAPQRRHRIAAPARSLEDIAARIDGAADVARLARHANLIFDLVVIGLKLLKPERPILDCGALG